MRYIRAALAVLCLVISPITARLHHHPHHPHHHGQQAPSPVEWTYLCFMNGNNNLDPWADFNVKQMISVGSQPWLNIVVQQASLSRNDTQRLYITKGKAEVVQDLGDGVQMGDVQTLEDFLQWGVSNYPAHHYFLSIWDHGTGWHAIHNTTANDVLTTKKPHLGDISCNDDFDRCISTTQLGDALSRFHQLIGRKADIFATDACSMQMIEIAAEFSDHVNYFIASETSIPDQGWPYDVFFSQWVELGPTTDAHHIASSIASQYLIAYETGEYSNDNPPAVTQSYLNLSHIQPVLNSLKTLGQQIVAFNDTDRKTAFARVSQSLCYDEPDSCDILSYAHLLAPDLPQLRGTVRQLHKDVNNLVVETGATGSLVASTGLAFWLPANLDIYYAYNHNTRYEALQFERITQWGAALKYMLTGNHTEDRY